jgi:penicillin amidase
MVRHPSRMDPRSMAIFPSPHARAHRRKRRWARRLALGFGGFALLIVVSAAGLLAWLRTSLPQLSGEIRVAGIAGPVEIARDSRGIPRIRAASTRDAYFALGFVHAQDRLFQMDLLRRVGQGRLAEIVGTPGLKSDRLMRTLGLYRRAQSSVASLHGDAFAAYEAYAAGVNAWVSSHRGALPPEYTLLGLDFEPWTVADSMLWGKTIAIMLSHGWRRELLRLKILKRGGAEAIAHLFPPEAKDTPLTVGHLDVVPERTLERLWAAIPHDMVGNGASNAWAVAGARSADGKPILASDPHLAFGTPVLWYLARLEVPQLSLAGATIPGAPIFALGHNGRIAWGVTASYVDTDDLVIEEIDPSDSTRYLAPHGPEPFVERNETIRVRFGRDVKLTVRETRNGPVLDSVIDADLSRAGHVLVLKSTWLDAQDSTGAGFVHANWAKNWSEFKQALSRVVAPVLNFTYADVDGRIGFITAGRIPIRASGDGFMPQHERGRINHWLGFVPFEENPQVYDPPSGAIVNANNRITGATYPYYLSRDWGDRRRARRILDLLGEVAKHSPESMRRIQADVVSLPARELVEKLTRIPAPDAELEPIIAQLSRWDGSMNADRPEPLIYHAWLRVLVERLIVNRMGFQDRYFHANAELVLHLIENHPAWCASGQNSADDPCSALMASALRDALAQLRREFGRDRLRWGAAHQARFDHPVLQRLPLLGALTRLRVEVAGDNYTVNRASMFGEKPNEPFATRHGSGYRAVYPLSDLDRTLAAIATGQSGNPFSTHYDDQLAGWSTTTLWRLAPEARDLTGTRTLRLLPRAVPPSAALE